MIAKIIQTRTSVETVLAESEIAKSFKKYSYVYEEKAYKNAKRRRNPNNVGVATTAFESPKKTNQLQRTDESSNFIPRYEDEDWDRKFRGRFDRRFYIILNSSVCNN